MTKQKLTITATSDGAALMTREGAEGNFTLTRESVHADLHGYVYALGLKTFLSKVEGNRPSASWAEQLEYAGTLAAALAQGQIRLQRSDAGTAAAAYNQRERAAARAFLAIASAKEAKGLPATRFATEAEAITAYRAFSKTKADQFHGLAVFNSALADVRAEDKQLAAEKARKAAASAETDFDL